MLRWLTYLTLGQLLLALVGGLAHAGQLTRMLPSVAAVLVTHVAFSSACSTPLGLAIAIALGYLEDLHQGAPVGTLALAHGLVFLLLRRLSDRVALPGALARAAAAAVAVAAVDLLTWALLWLVSDALGARREALHQGLLDARWHALATALFAPPVWSLHDQLLTRLGLAPGHVHPDARGPA
jgi:cell shape-determining protein MreD